MAQRSYTVTPSVGQCRAAFSVSEPLCQMQLTSVAINCLRNCHLPFLLLFSDSAVSLTWFIIQVNHSMAICVEVVL